MAAAPRCSERHTLCRTSGRTARPASADAPWCLSTAITAKVLVELQVEDSKALEDLRNTDSEGGARAFKWGAASGKARRRAF